ncbi:MAG: hypothetical protein ACI30N_01415 [Muribaculaceae bacterium]
MRTSFDYFEGWKYINALFEYFKKEAEPKFSNSHIAPRYIFRGISKRFFTESQEITQLQKRLKKVQKRGEIYYQIPSSSIIKYISNRDKSSLKDSILDASRFLSPAKESITTEEIYNVIYSDFLDEIKIILSEISAAEIANKEFEILDKIKHHGRFKYIKPEQIRSGASIRLRDTEKNYTTIADYLYYINNLSDGFKSINPSLRNFDETEIIAEIQHRGGGSCLVDFSNNFLISLWFSVSGHNDDLGYLFCYDVNDDAFKTGKLTYLNKHSAKIDIQHLLRNTQKTSMYMDENRHKFWLWKPDNINGRIARQDSVFVFGLEKFYIEEHKVTVIPIPPQWKRPILNFLKVYLGIKSETIFPDIDGYSNAHSKVSPINDNTLYINPQVCPAIKKYPDKDIEELLSLNLIQKGMSCLLKGEYRIGLDYFIRVYNSVDFDELFEEVAGVDKLRLLKIYIEVLYSIGLCYKKIKKGHLSEIYCKKAISYCLYLFTGEKCTEDKLYIKQTDSLKMILSKYGRYSKNPEKYNGELYEKLEFIPKFYRIVDEYLDVSYDIKNYHDAQKFVDILIECTPNSSPARVLRTSYNCLTVLELLNSKADTSTIKDTLSLFSYEDDNTLYSKISGLLEIILEIMSVYNKEKITDIYTNTDISSKVEQFLKVCDFNHVASTESSINWVFDDLREEVKYFFTESPSVVKYIENLIVRLIALQDSIQSRKKV